MVGTGIYRVSRGRARAFVADLRRADRYQFSEPDQYTARQAFPADPGTPYQWGLGAIGATKLTPPPVTPTSPLLGVIENGFDQTHPDVQGMQLDGHADAAGDPEGVLHGTAVASVAGAPANGVGITGVWPGVRLTVFTQNGTCGDTVAAIDAGVEAGARVLNMSYAFSSAAGCFSHYVATQRAFGAGTVLVAAAGNEFDLGNPADDSPATDPHVITVAALNQDLSSADFSNENLAVDLSAPGTNVVGAVPQGLDEDGTRDGYMALDGTSFSSPMVAAGAAWVTASRPALDHTQITDLVRYSTRDLGRRGYDPTFGFGIFDLPTALTARAPTPDPLEPNDDIEWIDGRRFRDKDPAIYKGRRVFLSGRLDRLEDPADVYRVVIPPRRLARVSVRPRYGDTTLKAYNPFTKTIRGRRGLIDVSGRPGRRLDQLQIENPYGKPISIWVTVVPRTLEAGYRLQVR